MRATQRHRGAPLPARFGSVLAPHQSTRMGSRGKERGDARGRIVWWQRPEELRYTCVVCVRCRRSTRCRRCKRGMGRGRSCGAGGRFEADGVVWRGRLSDTTRAGQGGYAGGRGRRGQLCGRVGGTLIEAVAAEPDGSRLALVMDATSPHYNITTVVTLLTTLKIYYSVPCTSIVVNTNTLVVNYATTMQLLLQYCMLLC